MTNLLCDKLLFKTIIALIICSNFTFNTGNTAKLNKVFLPYQISIIIFTQKF